MAVFIHMQIEKVAEAGKYLVGFSTQRPNKIVKDFTEVSYFEQTVSIPFESGNNVQGTANRTHSPVLVRKRVDELSPTLRDCMKLTTSLNIKFIFHRPASGAVGDYPFYGVTLTNAKVASIKTYSPDAFMEKSAEVMVPIEEVHFIFDGMATEWYVEGSNATATTSADSHSGALNAG